MEGGIGVGTVYLPLPFPSLPLSPALLPHSVRPFQMCHPSATRVWGKEGGGGGGGGDSDGLGGLGEGGGVGGIGVGTVYLPLPSPPFPSPPLPSPSLPSPPLPSPLSPALPPHSVRHLIEISRSSFCFLITDYLHQNRLTAICMSATACVGHFFIRCQ